MAALCRLAVNYARLTIDATQDRKMTAHLLLVDDDHVCRLLTRKVLEKCGHSVEVATDGLNAWEIIDRHFAQFDLILLDKQMPGLDGIGLLRRIRQDSRFQDLPVVMLTADKNQDDIAQGLAAGACYYMTKPAEQAVLEIVVKNVVADFRQKRQLRKLTGQHSNYLRLLRKGEFYYRSLAEANDLAVLLAELSTNPARTLNGYQELLINAVEHGNLGISYTEKSQLLSEDCWEAEINTRLNNAQYANRQVQVILDKSDTACVVTITDQGDGFNWEQYIEFSPDRAFDLHGRGVAMSKAISFDELRYEGKGNRVTTTVRYSQRSD